MVQRANSQTTSDARNDLGLASGKGLENDPDCGKTIGYGHIQTNQPSGARSKAERTRAIGPDQSGTRLNQEKHSSSQSVSGNQDSQTVRSLRLSDTGRDFGTGRVHERGLIVATAGPAYPPSNEHVFINCPFDAAYKPLFDAIIFAVMDLGFDARHALAETTPTIRLLRIANEIEQASFSIHDISRVGDPAAFELPRFNMPFELGLAFYRHHFRPGNRSHDLLVLDSTKYQPQKTLSDLAGLDPSTHNNDVKEIIGCVRKFLAPHIGQPLTKIPGAEHINDRLMLFKRRMEAQVSKRRSKLKKAEMFSFDYLTTFQEAMGEWILANPP